MQRSVPLHLTDWVAHTKLSPPALRRDVMARAHLRPETMAKVEKAVRFTRSLR